MTYTVEAVGGVLLAIAAETPPEAVKSAEYSLLLAWLAAKKQAVQGEPLNGVGIIRKLSPHESYGFITSVDQRDIYFHENSLKDLNMDELSEGDSVIFGETIGDKGPQASWVRQAR